MPSNLRQRLPWQGFEDIGLVLASDVVKPASSSHQVQCRPKALERQPMTSRQHHNLLQTGRQARPVHSRVAEVHPEGSHARAELCGERQEPSSRTGWLRDRGTNLPHQEVHGIEGDRDFVDGECFCIAVARQVGLVQTESSDLLVVSLQNFEASGVESFLLKVSIVTLFHVHQTCSHMTVM